jgi:hypothetical protein
MLVFAPQVPAAPLPVAPSDFQLKPGAPGGRITPERCPQAQGGEILVCGRRGPGQRIEPLTLPPGVKPPQRVGVDLGGGARAQPAMHEEGMPQGRVSKRFTIDFLFPF